VSLKGEYKINEFFLSIFYDMIRMTQFCMMYLYNTFGKVISIEYVKISFFDWAHELSVWFFFSSYSQKSKKKLASNGFVLFGIGI